MFRVAERGFQLASVNPCAARPAARNIIIINIVTADVVRGKSPQIDVKWQSALVASYCI